MEGGGPAALESALAISVATTLGAAALMWIGYRRPPPQGNWPTKEEEQVEVVKRRARSTSSEDETGRYRSDSASSGSSVGGQVGVVGLSEVGRVRHRQQAMIISLGNSPFDDDNDEGGADYDHDDNLIQACCSDSPNLSRASKPTVRSRFTLLEASCALNRQPIAQAKASGSRVLILTSKGDTYEGVASGIELCQTLACKRALAGVRIRSVACGPHHCAAISQDGKVFTWGCGESGQLGHGSTQGEIRPRAIVALFGVHMDAAACGGAHTLATCSEGSVYSWGLGDAGQLGHRNGKSLDVPKRILTFPKWSKHKGRGPFFDRRMVAIACGASHSVALDTHGHVFCFGQGQKGECGPHPISGGKGREPAVYGAVMCPQLVKDLLPETLSGFSAAVADTSTTGNENGQMIIDVFCGKRFNIALSNTGRIYSWGWGPYGELGREASSMAPTPGCVYVRDPKTDQEVQVQSVACGDYHTVALARDGRLFGWGRNREQVLGKSDRAFKLPQESNHVRRPRLVAVRLSSLPQELHAPPPPPPQQGDHGTEKVDDDDDDDDFARRERLENGAWTDIADCDHLIACGAYFTLYLRSCKSDQGALTQLEMKPQKSPPERVKAEQEAHEFEYLKRVKWETKVLPNWKSRCERSDTKIMWKQGIPSQLRATVWPLAIGNQVKTTKAMYYALRDQALSNFDSVSSNSSAALQDQQEQVLLINKRERALGATYRSVIAERKAVKSLIDADLPRTFPSLEFFTKNATLGARLYNILITFAMYRPDISYIQGMSYIAATLVLNTPNEFVAFQCLANLLIREHLFAFYRLDRALIYQYYEIFERLLQDNHGTKRLHKRLTKLQCHPHLYAFNWFQTLFLKVLPLHTACRIMDCFLLEGTAFILKTGAAVVKIFSPLLSQASFEDCIQLLSKSPGTESKWSEAIDEDTLFQTIAEIKLSQDLQDQLNDLAERLYY